MEHQPQTQQQTKRQKMNDISKRVIESHRQQRNIMTQLGQRVLEGTAQLR